jgi:hypothetical protein
VWWPAGLVEQKNAEGIPTLFCRDKPAWLPASDRVSQPLVDEAAVAELEAAVRDVTVIIPPGIDEAEGASGDVEMAEAIARIDPLAMQIHTIARDGSRSADQRMRDIYTRDRTCLAWNSNRWAQVLGISEQAVRKTAWWTEDRQRLCGHD